MQSLSRRRVAEYAAAQLAQGESPRQLARALAAYMADRKQLAQMELLVKDILLVLAQKYGVVNARVDSARPLSAHLRTAVAEVVRQTHSAKTVNLEETLTPELIGGVTITTPTGFFDGSVRKKLQSLQAMKNKET